MIKVEETVRYLEPYIKARPRVGVILGSGLSGAVWMDKILVRLKYRYIPHLPECKVEGHASSLWSGMIGATPVIIFNGRVHYYEGYTIEQTTLPIRILKELGAEEVILVGAAGSLKEEIAPGHMILIRAHIDMITLNSPGKEACKVYDTTLSNLGIRAASELGIPVEEGIYGYVPGPTYETRAEAHMLRLLGADVVGMSIAPEATLAFRLGLKVLGIACVTNLVVELQRSPLDHAQILKQIKPTRETLGKLVYRVIESSCPKQYTDD